MCVKGEPYADPQGTAAIYTGCGCTPPVRSRTVMSRPPKLRPSHAADRVLRVAPVARRKLHEREAPAVDCARTVITSG